MAIERVLNGVEHVHRFTRAVSVGNPCEFLQEVWSAKNEKLMFGKVMKIHVEHGASR
jgi:hypothetical protein